PSSGTAHCTCKTGFSGPNCEYASTDPCASLPCLNGGTCISNLATSTYTCQCPQGYNSKQCQTVGDPCANVTCLNGGSCLVVLDGTRGVCSCIENWQGEDCEQSNLSNTRVCDPCTAQCFKRPSTFNDSSLFTLHIDDPMTADKCEQTMMAIPAAEFYILAGSSCYTGIEPMVTQPSTDVACNTACDGSTKKYPSVCGDFDNVLLHTFS
ncbi:hypothetical protein PMAYCL1PPCAC_13682, partial [Pristionchus mayeri]